METLYRKYRRTQIAEMRPVKEQDINKHNNLGFIHIDEYPYGYNISISDADKNNGSPKIGDMIARNPKDYSDQWLVAEQYFKDNFEAIEDDNPIQKLEADKKEMVEMLITVRENYYNGSINECLINNIDEIESLIQKHKKQ